MTTKIFWDNPYLTELETQVTSISGHDVTLRETIFYALSGGQESDHGTIGEYWVQKATKRGKELIYTLVERPNWAVGDPVKVVIDWERRYTLMRLHFAAEVVLELFTQTLPSIHKIGAHIAAHKARIEFAWEGNLAEVLPDIQSQANAIVQADYPIISAFSDIAAERRYWEIIGFAHVPCGGTHIGSTREMGQITLKRKTGGKGKERIEIYVGEEAD